MTTFFLLTTIVIAQQDAVVIEEEEKEISDGMICWLRSRLKLLPSRTRK